MAARRIMTGWESSSGPTGPTHIHSARRRETVRENGTDAIGPVLHIAPDQFGHVLSVMREVLYGLRWLERVWRNG
jgi:hypothetical protein